MTLEYKRAVSAILNRIRNILSGIRRTMALSPHQPKDFDEDVKEIEDDLHKLTNKVTTDLIRSEKDANQRRRRTGKN